MAGDRKLIIVQPEAADLLATFAPPRKSYFRLRIRSFCLVIGIDRSPEIGDRHFSGAFRNLVNKGEFSRPIRRQNQLRLLLFVRITIWRACTIQLVDRRLRFEMIQQHTP